MLQTFPLVSGTWDSRRPILLANTEAVTAFGASAFRMSCVTRSPVSLSNGPTVSLVSLLFPVYLQKPFLVSLASLAKFHAIWALAFLPWSLPACSMSLCSSQATHAYFHPLYSSFLCLSLARSSLFIHTALLAFFA